ncbi:amino acid adenylation domain-containing protein [Nocardia sp. NPDC051990]|uniref:amino acid adenylation domain-containing protein n=1 Tax=Nocardia sp. NPDC051990 TaxID=3155285 RepID=UPI003418F02D
MAAQLFSYGLIQHRFAEWADRQPDAVALEFGDRRLTYAELAVEANRIAAVLRERGIGPNDPVGVYLPRSDRFVIAILGVLAADGAYVPLDPTQPDRWIADQLRIAAVRVVLTSAALQHELPGGTPIVVLEDAAKVRETALVAARADADNLAYIMFTSGSTGRPKAVAIPHRGVLNLTVDPDWLAVGPGHCHLFNSPHTFDQSVFDIWGALLNGGRLVIAPHGPAAASTLARLIRDKGVTTAGLTTSLFQVILEEQPQALRPLRQLVVGGETVYPASMARAAQDLPDTTLIIGYGPTEVTVYGITHTRRAVDPVPAVPVIGRAVGGARAHVLDERLNPVSPGASGELCMGGAGLAWGYLDAPDQTAERFVPDPYGPPGDRLYRTGDRVREIEPGVFEFIGRIDGQLKVRGHRIEPSEVELALLAHPKVTTARVAVEQNPQRGKYLAAYVISDAQPPVVAAELRTHMAAFVPDHLRPDVYEIDSTAVLTANGKLDRRRPLAGDHTPDDHTPDDADRDELPFIVVVNARGQYALWPAEHETPAGWVPRGAVGSADDCKARVRAVWRDIRPAAAPLNTSGANGVR